MNASSFHSVLFGLGLVVVITYAWQRFNEPSFPNKDTLPRTVAPLRYLFFRSAYRHARLTYVLASVALYCALVWPGPAIVPLFEHLGMEKFPAEAWPLIVALIMTGLLPNSNKWLNFIEEGLRRSVHAWFLVPDGVLETIGVLEDTSYEPLPRQFNALAGARADALRDDLKAPTSSLRHRWARATMLMLALKQMGAGGDSPLEQSAFSPFQEDLDAIRKFYRALEKDVESLGAKLDEETEDNLTRSIDALLRQIYAYISWGARNQTNNVADLDRTLADLGFRVPPTGGHRLFDVLAVPVLAVAATALVFWVIAITMSGLLTGQPMPLADNVVYALSSAAAAACTYGGALYIALKRRAAQIEQKVWMENSPQCLLPIGLRAGLLSWIVIVVSTALFQHEDLWKTVVALADLIRAYGTSGAAAPVDPDATHFPKLMATALPWMLPGATVACLLAAAAGRDVRAPSFQQRRHDALLFGTGLGLAAASAQLIQAALTQFVFSIPASFLFVPIVGVVGAGCGAIIGYLVPSACRVNLMSPPDWTMARALQDLRQRAQSGLGSVEAADKWIYASREELGGITPAEAVQYQGLATSVWRLLENDAPTPHAAPKPVVIEGGRAGQAAG